MVVRSLGFPLTSSHSVSKKPTCVLLLGALLMWIWPKSPPTCRSTRFLARPPHLCLPRQMPAPMWPSCSFDKPESRQNNSSPENHIYQSWLSAFGILSSLRQPALATYQLLRHFCIQAEVRQLALFIIFTTKNRRVAPPFIPSWATSSARRLMGRTNIGDNQNVIKRIN